MYYLAMSSSSHSNELVSNHALPCTSCACLLQQLEQIAVGEVFVILCFIYIIISIQSPRTGDRRNAPRVPSKELSFIVLIKVFLEKLQL